MENQYNYYRPEDEEINNQKPTKKKLPKVVSTIGLAVIFGIVSSTVFVSGNMMAGRLLESGESAPAAPANNPVSNAQLTQTSSNIQSDVSEVVEIAMPSVVSIANLSIQQVQSFFGGTRMHEHETSGSGIIVGQNEEELLMVTNNHVVAGNDILTVTFIDEESVEAYVKGTDVERDLAVVAVPLNRIPDTTRDRISVARMGDSTRLRVGEPAIAIGNALGFGQSVTTGVISAVERSIDLEGFDVMLIQTDAAINPGNSGGALLNANGEVIGINTLKKYAAAVEGMGYAIPVSDVAHIINELMNRETRTRIEPEEQGFLGIQGVDVTAQSAQMYDMPAGVYISDVLPGGGAQEAGLARGDIITAIGGTRIDGMRMLQNELTYYRIGDRVEVTVAVMNSEETYEFKTVEVVLTERIQ